MDLVIGSENYSGMTYGKSNDKHSFLYDPKFTMQITINGQLLLSMLIEELCENTQCKLLQANTDGITIKYHKSKQNIINNILENWQKLTKLELETNYYSKMIINDVNNYIAVYTNGKIKNKGLFEIDKALYKDNSMLIIPIALQNYYIDNIPIQQTIYSHTDIYNFCKRFKATEGWKTQIRYVENNIEHKQWEQKNVRYYISNKGVRLLKIHKDRREIDIESNQLCTVFNKYNNLEFNKYNINYNYYIKECNKITNEIEPKQLSFF